MTPEDRKYTKTHEWIKIEDDLAVVGISDHAQESLGDITYVELPEEGHTVEQADECGVIESVKAASDIYAPVAGEICEVNTDLENRPEAINEDPYEEGWIFKLDNFDRAAIDGLLVASEYEATLDHDE